MERVIILDTETTGISPDEGHRIIEIGCIELVNYRKGDQRQWYLNPERDIPREATAVHGITNEQVADAPLFADIAADFIDFIKSDRLVIHNAGFDLGFLNSELQRLSLPQIAEKRAIDTLAMARRKFPGAPASLDALCRRFKIDNSNRTFHGALLDSEPLAEVYIELMGGNQFNLDFDLAPEPAAIPETGQPIAIDSRDESPGHAEAVTDFPKRVWSISPEEESQHLQYVELLTKKAGKSLWNA